MIHEPCANKLKCTAEDRKKRGKNSTTALIASLASSMDITRQSFRDDSESAAGKGARPTLHLNGQDDLPSGVSAAT